MRLEGAQMIAYSISASSSNKDIFTSIFYFFCLNTASENSYKFGVQRLWALVYLLSAWLSVTLNLFWVLNALITMTSRRQNRKY